MDNWYMAKLDSWLEDESVTDAEKLEYFKSLKPIATPAPEGAALRYFIHLRLAELNITLDALQSKWLDDESVSDEEKREWILAVLNQTA